MRRVLTALVLIPVVVSLIFLANAWVFAVVVAAVACLCFHEYRQLAAAYHFGPIHPAGYLFGFLLLFADREPWIWMAILLACLASVSLAMSADLSHCLPRAALLVTGIVYVFGCWKCAIAVRAHNPHWLMYTLLVNWAGDTGGYYVGRRFGHRRLAERVSPGKTWEGTFGSLLFSVIAAGAYLLVFVPTIPLSQVVLLTLAVNAAGQLGDLCESAIKRGAGVKDSGSLLPGHGGMLDRVDSTL
ncbi:MAG: phosphatidate cytidylyltransferase, partial [Acidobacteriia bacterium]|nr:phosphatidate cytidylyltransferase [Terriglobia bacterium]